MPKSIKRRTSKGGSFWDSVNNDLNIASQAVSNSWNTVKNDVSELWNNTKKGNSYTGSESYSYTTPSYSSSYNNYTRGGKIKSKRGTRSLKGGYSRPVYPNLVSQAAPYHGAHTARVKWIGGRRRKRRRVSRKSRR
jgi:hypothetical protein